MRNLRTLLTIGLIALTIAGTTIATASQAEAHNNFGAGLAAGAIGGALLGGAIAAPRPVYAAPSVVYDEGPMPPYERVVVQDRPFCHTAWRENGWGEIYRIRACHM